MVLIGRVPKEVSLLEEKMMVLIDPVRKVDLVKEDLMIRMVKKAVSVKIRTEKIKVKHLYFKIHDINEIGCIIKGETMGKDGASVMEVVKVKRVVNGEVTGIGDLKMMKVMKKITFMNSNENE